VLGAQLINPSACATLRRQGMVAWIKAVSTTPDLTPPFPQHRVLVPGVIATSELVLILASLVVTPATEPAHA